MSYEYKYIVMCDYKSIMLFMYTFFMLCDITCIMPIY